MVRDRDSSNPRSVGVTPAAPGGQSSSNQMQNATSFGAAASVSEWNQQSNNDRRRRGGDIEQDQGSLGPVRSPTRPSNNQPLRQQNSSQSLIMIAKLESNTGGGAAPNNKRHNGSSNSDLISSRSSLQKNTNSPYNSGGAWAETATFNGFRTGGGPGTNKRTSNVTILKMDNERVLQELRNDGQNVDGLARNMNI